MNNGDALVKRSDVEHVNMTNGTESAIQRTLANIHSVAKHLLHVQNDEALVVSVRPTGMAWTVGVTYAAFRLEVKEATLDEALERMLHKLVVTVTDKHEESERLISALHGGSGAREGTRDGVIEECKRVANVKGADVSDTTEPGVVEIRILPEHHLTQLERDLIFFQLGQRLERHRPPGCRYDVLMIGGES